MAPFPMTLSDS